MRGGLLSLNPAPSSVQDLRLLQASINKHPDCRWPSREGSYCILVVYASVDPGKSSVRTLIQPVKSFLNGVYLAVLYICFIADLALSFEKEGGELLSPRIATACQAKEVGPLVSLDLSV